MENVIYEKVIGNKKCAVAVDSNNMAICFIGDERVQSGIKLYQGNTDMLLIECILDTMYKKIVSNKELNDIDF